MKILIFYSGGKDSQASLIWAVKKYGVERCEAVFCDTGWENPLTYDHIRTTTEQLGVKLVTLKSAKYDGMVDLAKKKGRFPSTTARFCTVELKSTPAIDYVLSHKEHLIIIEGIRKKESLARSKMSAQCTSFKYYFEPIITNTMIVDAFKNKPNIKKHEREKLNKAIQRLQQGKDDPKYHTYRKKDIVAWCREWNADKVRPVFDWTAQQTVDYIRDNGQQPNPLYFMGFSRVGCFPCIMVRIGEMKLIVENHPARIVELKNAEALAGRSLFPPDYIPKRFCENKQYPMIADIERYINDKTATLDMFDEGGQPGCMSVYGLCE